MMTDKILVVDMGSLENERLLREIRELGVESELFPHTITRTELDAIPGVKGAILNGGPGRAADGTEKSVDKEICNAPMPVLMVDCMGDIPWPEDEDERKMILSAFVFGLCGAGHTESDG